MTDCCLTPNEQFYSYIMAIDLHLYRFISICRVLEEEEDAYLLVHWDRVMVFNTNFDNISVISWRSVLLVEETRENHRPAASHWKLYQIHLIINSIRIHNLGGDIYRH
jgi:hypothetical protein